MGLFPSCSNEVLSAALVLLFLSSTALCECPTPSLPNHSSLKGGEGLADTYPVGTRLQLECITGYEYIPGKARIISCLDTNQWLDVPELCQGRRCPTPHIENGRIVSSNDLRLGDQVTFGCDFGFRIIGESSLQCVLRSGKVDWNRELPHCQRIPCNRPPLISNGRYDSSPSDEYDAGSAVIYRCDADYTLIGNSTISCTVAANGVDGMWDSPPPECKKVKCDRPTIQNGRVTNVFQAIYTYNSGISFQCNSGYTLVGAAFVKCDANSKWNPPVPSCVESVAPTPTKPTRPPTPAVPPTPPIPPMPGTEDETEEIPVSPTPSETTPSGSGKTVAIVFGAVLAVIVLGALIFAVVKWVFPKGKANTHPASPDAYRVVSDRDMPLEEKQPKD
ncbi:membrane cofactor protein-like isoform X1 [Python bivittatus]|uniref:Membrane cofactor protein-like isoform X1 n=1 Tax=Python bivittatus TaxID=176946 RepID=A0A9F3QRV0_PYTBI|nr:membrane cofactor protein-like isoform X1 [Python bivittatus]